MGAVLANLDGDSLVLGAGASHLYDRDAVRSCLENAGLEITPLADWLVDWPSDPSLRESLSSGSSALFVTLEPSSERNGQCSPPVTNLIRHAGVKTVVIGHLDPVPERRGKGAAALHAMGINVRLLIPPPPQLQPTTTSPDGNSGADSSSSSSPSPVHEACEALIRLYSGLANSKLHQQARRHFELFGRPLGFLHCSVVDSDNLEAFQRAGNAFGTTFGGKTLGARSFGAYEIAPPPEAVWTTGQDGDDDEQSSSSVFRDPAFSELGGGPSEELISVDFEDEDYQGGVESGNPMAPWYGQADAVVATFPRPGNGPAKDGSLAARLLGLKWLATHGRNLPPGVERILVMDATDLRDLPLTNQELARHFPRSDVDVEAFWRGDDLRQDGNSAGASRRRRPTRVLLRRGEHAQARSAAEAAAVAAKSAADAARAAAEAIETGDVARAAEAALEMERSAQERARYVRLQLQALQELRARLESQGVVVETIQGGEPVDVMKHLGDRNGYRIVVWRAGCWSDRGVRAILAGAFQWVSAHLAVDAVGGRFWQLMLAENAVQAACGPSSRVKVFADQQDLSLEYCDDPDVDSDCNLTVHGRPVRHIRLDCRIALVDENRHREFVVGKTKKIDRKIIEEEAPWFL